MSTTFAREAVKGLRKYHSSANLSPATPPSDVLAPVRDSVLKARKSLSDMFESVSNKAQNAALHFTHVEAAVKESTGIHTGNIGLGQPAISKVVGAASELGLSVATKAVETAGEVVVGFFVATGVIKTARAESGKTLHPTHKYHLDAPEPPADLLGFGDLGCAPLDSVSDENSNPNSNPNAKLYGLTQEDIAWL